jgi:hypothetical protein
MIIGRRTGILALALAIGCGSPAGAQGEADLPGWMAGCWMTDAAEGRRSEECWTMPRGAMMLGSGHLFESGRSLSFEHMRIVREGGSIIFIAQPGGAPPTRFTLERQVAPGGEAAPQVRFVNAANDYPQRVTYRLVGGALEAEIAQKDGSHPMRWTFKRN